AEQDQAGGERRGEPLGDLPAAPVPAAGHDRVDVLAGEPQGAVAEDAADEVALDAVAGDEQRPHGREVEEEAEGPGMAGPGDAAGLEGGHAPHSIRMYCADALWVHCEGVNWRGAPPRRRGPLRH